MTITDRNGVEWGVYLVVLCPLCGQERPHHGPYCCSCGTPYDGIVP